MTASMQLGLPLAVIGMWIAAAPEQAKADTAETIWTGATSTLWPTATNWSSGVPSGTNSAVFNSTFTNQPALSNASTTSQGVWLAAGVGQDVTIGTAGGTLALVGTATLNSQANVGILLSDTTNNHNLTFSAPLTTTNSTSFLVNNAGTLTTLGIGLANGSTLTLGGTNPNGKISITGGNIAGVGSAINVNTAGTVSLAGSTGNSYSGGVTLNAGTLNINQRNVALGTGTFVINGGTIDCTLAVVAGMTTAQTWNTDFTYKGTVSLDMGTGAVSLGTTAGATRTVTTNANTLFVGGISNGTNGVTPTVNLAKAGAGTLAIQGVSSYTGATVVKAGTLAISGGGKDNATSGFTVMGGSLLVDNSGTVTANRLNSAVDVTLQNGAFNITGKTAASTSTSETVDSVICDTGANSMTLSQGVGTGSSTLLTTGSLARNNNSTALVRGSSLGQGSTASNIALLRITTNPSGAAGTLIGGGATMGGTNRNVSIMPFIVGEGSTTGSAPPGSTFVGYDATNNTVRALNIASEFTPFTGTTANLTTAGVNDNVRLSSSNPATSVTGSTNNSTIFNATAGGTMTYTLNGTLTPSSGAMLFCRTSGTAPTQIIAAGTNSLLQFAGSDSTTSRKEGIISNTGGGAVSINVKISGSGGLTLNTYNAGSSIALGSTNNNYSGTTTVNGLVKLGAASVIPDASGVYVAQGGTFDLSGFSESIDALSGAGTVDTTAASNTPTLTVGSNNGTGSFNGIIQNSGATGASLSLIKTGSGTQTLASANTYSGSTTITGGTMMANSAIGSASASSTGTGAVTVQTGANLAGNGNVSGAVTVNSGGTIEAGDGAVGTTLTLSNSAGLTLQVGSTIALTLGSSGAHSTLARTGGTWTFDPNQTFQGLETSPGAVSAGETFDNIIVGLASDPGTNNWHLATNQYFGTFTYDGSGNVDLSISAIPEPASAGMLGLAVSALFWRRRRYHAVSVVSPSENAY